MARFVIVATMPLSPVTYLFEDADKALAKLSTFQRNAIEFTVTDQHGNPLTVADLEEARDRNH